MVVIVGIDPTSSAYETATHPSTSYHHIIKCIPKWLSISPVSINMLPTSITLQVYSRSGMSNVAPKPRIKTEMHLIIWWEHRDLNPEPIG